jgi:hypothetical protein
MAQAQALRIMVPPLGRLAPMAQNSLARGYRTMSETLSTTFRVGRRYRCTITLPLALLKAGVAQMGCSWDPCFPKHLRKAEMRDYRRGRDALLAEAAKHIGGSVAVIEV